MQIVQAIMMHNSFSQTQVVVQSGTSIKYRIVDRTMDRYQ